MSLSLKRKVEYALKLLIIHRKRYYSVIRIIILVLTLLSLFIIGTDTLSYNKYEGYLQLPNEMIVMENMTGSDFTPPRAHLQDKLERESDYSYSYSKILLGASYYQDSKRLPPLLEVTFIDSNYFKYPRIRDGSLVDNRTPLFSNGQSSKSIIINYSLSMALFGKSDVIGEKVYLDNGVSDYTKLQYRTYVVSDVIEDDINYKDHNVFEVYLSKDESKYFEKEGEQTVQVFFNDDYVKHLNFAQNQNIGNLTFSHQLIQSFYTQRYQDTILVFSIMFVIALLAELTIYSSFLNIFQFRLTEFGILLAIGAKKRDIFLIQMMEVLVVMFMSAIVSIALSLALIKISIFYFSWFKGQYYSLYLSIDKLTLLLLFIIILSAVTSLVISIKSTNYRIIDTIRSN